MYIRANTLDDLLFEVFTELIRSKIQIRTSRGITRELAGVLLELGSPRARLSRSEVKGKIFSGLGELFWYLSRSNSLHFIKYYLRRYEEDSEDGATIYGGYGTRLFDARGHNQIDNIINLLRQKPTSRRAVIQLFDASDIAKSRKEIPCTCTIQFLLRDNLLNMYTTMRSNDSYIGLPHDIFAFTMLQEIVAKTLDCGLGTYKHFVGSLHLYEPDLDSAQGYINEGLQPTTAPMPAMPRGDPWKPIAGLLEIEKALREGHQVNLAELHLKPYWADIARLLQFFAASHGERKDAIEMKRIKAEMHSDVYQMYIDGRMQAGSAIASDQGDLGLDWPQNPVNPPRKRDRNARK
ncbi:MULTISPECIES: thymidylate synthase [unclassified Mesorhizobium]|uniref:thymidylate synthase n=1 Tax=unclassified Mesorhizobium TaxID=325217 RepID=UPI000FCA6001|nr:MULTISPECIES: thymidylate synthase [unclassified Mesorhizobium]RUW71124.1 thymidylate synthase [Mesorhizobium sp. M4B.F.Ca.ET.049.02.1.2]TGV23185.1 thymidylate synthase [Mesorhizobium sp. M4B.F.Ca.ET.143.01.1.1]